MGRSFVRPEASFDRTRSQSGRTKMQISMKKLNWFERERSIDSFGLRHFNFVNWSSDDINLNQELVNPCKCCTFFVFSFLTKMYIAALVFEFYNFILTNKIHCSYHEMQAANKTNKNERGIGGGEVWIWPSWIVLSFPGLVSMNYRLFFYFEAALLHYIGRFFEESIFLYIG